jgi:hypothetical protein
MPIYRLAGFAAFYTDAINFLFEGHPAYVDERAAHPTSVANQFAMGYLSPD